MAGHSKWSQIKRAKGANDLKRNALYTKLIRDIVNATKVGGSGDIEFNPMLRVAIDKAKAANMPNSNIDSAINRGMGLSATGETLITYQNTYEFMIDGKYMIIVDTETDNPNRTITDLKQVAKNNGAKTVPEGSLAWQFDEKGLVVFLLTSDDVDSVELELIEIEGIIDISKNHIETNKYQFTVSTQKEFLKSVHDEIDKNFSNSKIESVELIKEATNKITEKNETVEKFIEELESVDDVQSVWTNLKQ